MSLNSSPSLVTQLLAKLGRGEPEAADQLVPLVYAELHRLAVYYMRNERAGHTLQATALVHEAYLHLMDQQAASWQNRAHFMAVAARVMRHLLVDHARKRRAAKHGGLQQKVPLEQAFVASDQQSE